MSKLISSSPGGSRGTNSSDNSTDGGVPSPERPESLQVPSPARPESLQQVKMFGYFDDNPANLSKRCHLFFVVLFILYLHVKGPGGAATLRNHIKTIFRTCDNIFCKNVKIVPQLIHSYPTSNITQPFFWAPGAWTCRTSLLPQKASCPSLSTPENVNFLPNTQVCRACPILNIEGISNMKY